MTATITVEREYLNSRGVSWPDGQLIRPAKAGRYIHGRYIRRRYSRQRAIRGAAISAAP